MVFARLPNRYCRQFDSCQCWHGHRYRYHPLRRHKNRMNTWHRVAPSSKNLPNQNRIQISQFPHHFTNHFYTITAHYGYKETPNMRKLCQLINDKGLYLDIMNTSFFLSYPNISPYTAHRHFGVIRLRLFIWLNKNRTHLVDYLKIPDQQVIEIRSQLSL
jgi:K+ transporter